MSHSRRLVTGLLAAVVVAGGGWLVYHRFFRPDLGAMMRSAGQNLDRELRGIRSVVVTAGPPEAAPCAPELSRLAAEALAGELGRKGLGELFKDGTGPPGPVAVAAVLPFDRRDQAAEQLRALGADAVVFLAVAKVRIEELRPPDRSGYGYVKYYLSGRAWLRRPADGRLVDLKSASSGTFGSGFEKGKVSLERAAAERHFAREWGRTVLGDLGMSAEFSRGAMSEVR